MADGKVMHHIADLFSEHGSDIWYDWDAAAFLPEGTVCPSCGKADFDKESDILDVWFDSGVSHAAVLELRPNLGSPADMYLEGSDQHRGWFHSSLLASVGTRGRAPYKNVLTHGFVMDGAGRKMSKSVGNVVAPEDVIKKFGADVLRLWVAAQDYREDLRISQEILTRLSESYRRIRNTCRYILGNIHDFDPATDTVAYAQMPEIDRWAMHQLELLKEKVLASYDDSEFHILYHAVNGFCTVEMSSFYLDILKDRVYTSRDSSLARRSAQTVMFTILDNLVRMMAPVLSFTAEEVWAVMPGVREASVHVALFPALTPECKDEALAVRWEKMMKVRGEVSKALELARVKKTVGHSLDAAVAIKAVGETAELLSEFQGELASIFIVSKAELVGEVSGEAYRAEAVEGLEIEVSSAPGEKCERCWCYDEKLGEDAEHPTLCPKCLAAVK
jgi:isoleucyl-tRNA synthetase